MRRLSAKKLSTKGQHSSINNKLTKFSLALKLTIILTRIILPNKVLLIRNSLTSEFKRLTDLLKMHKVSRNKMGKTNVTLRRTASPP